MTAATFSAADLREAMRFGSATLHEAAGRIGALPAAIKPVNPQMRLAGPAFTVHSPPFDNLWIHRALYRARPGDILVVHVGDGYEAGYWGDILNAAAIAQGLGGLVIDGGVRDTAGIGGDKFPIFARQACIRGTGKDREAIAWLNQPIRMGNVVVNPGDLIVGDRDGVLALPAAAAPAALSDSAAREADEAAKIEQIRAGARTIDLYGFGAG